MTEAEKAKEREIFKDVWEFRKRFYSPTEEPSYWKAVVEESDRISKKYKSCFVDMLLIACFSDLEARHKVNIGYPPKETDEEMFNLWLKLIRSM